ncbi:MAG: sn-glycerol-3-phosphate ABC transporter ATP-binding protein UgpC [Planctomycetota bacterium]
MASVELEAVGKTYPGGVEAVKRIDLSIDDGEFLVLVGGSGCGKSTTLRMIAGLETITAGTIRIGERVVNDAAPKDRDIAMVFQNYALYPHMTVYDNMAFALKMRKIRRGEIDQRVRGAAEQLGITDLLKRKPAALSGGQRQRVALGRAIVREPACFLFDEPLSNLDAKLRVAMRSELKSLHQRLRTTSVYVTHDQEEAMTLGDRICVMADGVIQQAGPPLEVYDRPVNRFVAGFIGTPPMNFVETEVRHEADAAVLTGPGVRVVMPGGAGWLADGASVVLGVRPQHLVEAATGGGVAAEAEIDRVELLGDQMDVHLSVGGSAMVSRMPARSGLAAGHTIPLTIGPAHAHIFEPGGFGARLNPPGPGAVS